MVGANDNEGSQAVFFTTFETDIPEVLRDEGFAEFNRCLHLCVKIPDGNSTISCKLSDGRRVTFAFLPYVTHGPPGCVDIAYHDAPGPKLLTINGDESPRTHAIGFGQGRHTFETRGLAAPTSFLTVLLADKHYEQPAT